jgi:hypothetical protein
MLLRVVCPRLLAFMGMRSLTEMSWTDGFGWPAFSAQLSLEQLVSDWYQREFGVSIPRPAIFNDARAVNCRGDGHLTTTAYLRTGETTADLFVLYLTRDGLNLIQKSRRSVRVPAGRFNVLSILVRHQVTVGADALPLWQTVQNEINDQHAQFARSHGYGAPLVAFVNQNVVLDPRQLPPPERFDSVSSSLLQSLGLTATDYDIVMVINIDPDRSEGGRATPATERSIYVGNFSHWKMELGPQEWRAIGRTAYQQLMAYFWGWQTDWTPTSVAALVSGTNRSSRRRCSSAGKTWMVTACPRCWTTRRTVALVETQ